jgi:hypothetical protein
LREIIEHVWRDAAIVGAIDSAFPANDSGGAIEATIPDGGFASPVERRRPMCSDPGRRDCLPHGFFWPDRGSIGVDIGSRFATGSRGRWLFLDACTRGSIGTDDCRNPR